MAILHSLAPFSIQRLKEWWVKEHLSISTYQKKNLNHIIRLLSKVLDATFDDVLQLAIPRMPSSISGIVRIAIRDYVNLNNTELINKYSGPVLMIRRTEDEIIAEYE